MILGYGMARRDRPCSKGGGVVIYYQESLNAYEDFKWDVEHDLEALWLNVTIRSQSTLLGCLYRPPNPTTFCDALHSLLNKIWVKRKNVILLGDFNSNMSSDNDQELSQAGKRLYRGYLEVLDTQMSSNIQQELLRIPSL